MAVLVVDTAAIGKPVGRMAYPVWAERTGYVNFVAPCYSAFSYAINISYAVYHTLTMNSSVNARPFLRLCSMIGAQSRPVVSRR